MKNMILSGTAFLSIMILCFSPVLAQNPHMHHQDEIREEVPQNDVLVPCPENIKQTLETAVSELVARDNHHVLKFTIKEVSGLQCESKSNMADIVLAVETSPGEYRHGSFHIHFRNDGRFIRTPGSSSSKWKETNTINKP